MSITVFSGSILGDLKHQTVKMHTALEARVDILSPALTLERYKFLLERFYGFYAPVEDRIAALKGYEALNLDPAPRRKIFRIFSDLEKLGLTCQQIEALPVCTDLPDLSTLAQVLGCMYVLEGATLGGQIIRRELRNRPEFLKKDYFGFYNSYGNEVGPRWREFCAGLDRYALDNPAVETRQAIIEAATRTFQKLDNWLAA